MLIKVSLASALREEILSGRLAAGDPIVEAKWATRLKVAQASVREALHMLAAEGWVEKEIGRTARVIHLTRDDVRRIFEVRVPLEVLAVRRAAESGGSANGLEQAFQAMAVAAQTEQIRDFYHNDLEFHTALCRMSGNDYLTQHVRRLITPLFAFCVLQAQQNAPQRHIWDRALSNHLCILQAVRSGDPARAEMALIEAMPVMEADTRGMVSAVMAAC